MAHRIYLHVDLDSLELEDDRGTLTFPTHCRARLRPGIGGSVADVVSDSVSGAELVELFPPDARPLAGYSRFQVLAAVLEQAIARLESRRHPRGRTRPDIAVSFSPAVITRLAGYHEEILLAALQDAGVRQVLFIDGDEERPAWSWRSRASS